MVIYSDEVKREALRLYYREGMGARRICKRLGILEHHPGERLILHSDQGSQFRSKTYSAYLEKNGIVQSMSRAGNCFDNARIESFFDHMKAELPLMYPYSTFDEFQDALDRYILFYNKTRIKT